MVDTTQIVAATTQPAQPVPGTPEYEAAMIAKFDNVSVKPHPNADGANGTDTTPQKPEGVPDKYWDAKTGVVNYAAWSKSTADQQAEITRLQQATKQAPQQQQQQTPANDPVKVHADQKAALQKALDDVIAKDGATLEEIRAARKALTDLGDPPAPAAAAQSAVQSAGLNMDQLTAEFAEKGELSAESYAAFEKVGITRDMVDAHIAGQQALAEQARTSAFKLVGGEEKYTAMATWAAANLSKGELEAYNAAVDGSAEQRDLAIQGLFSKFTAANGQEPKLQGASNGAVTTSGFRSRNEMTAAMRDPRYKSDPAYRKDVEQKIALNTFGW